jgi:hypothetical protein
MKSRETDKEDKPTETEDFFSADEGGFEEF